MMKHNETMRRRKRLGRLAVFGALWTTAAVTSAASAPADARADAAAPSTAQRSLLEACPIEGDHDWVDSWGWRRSGGRSHQGIDVAAVHGTELYAVRDGMVDFKQTNLGGNSVWLTTDDGDSFFYAHLDAFEGDDRAVVAGELIGYVGSTGNAGGPHLHFETHPGGDVENPFDHVVDACTASAPDDERIASGPAIDALHDRIRAARSPGLFGIVPR